LRHTDSFETVIFDLDGTLRHNRPSPNHAFFDFAVGLGVADSQSKRRRAMRWAHYYWAQSKDLFEDLESYPEDDRAFWTNFAARYLRAFGCPPEQAASLSVQMHQLMSEKYQPEDWVPPEAFKILSELKESKHKLGLVSNRTESAHEQLEALGLLPYFDFAFVAGEVNIWKPAPGIFLHALEVAGSQAEHTVYVGDNYYADVVGARSAGLTPILLDPDEVFPDADCQVIRSLGELRGILLNHQP
jgi:putative hydrolase of the HAD superfamily